MKVLQIVRALESLAPPSLAADGDNVGLLVGDPTADTGKVLLCVDVTEAVLREAAAAKARMIVAYHPVIFKPIARLTADEASVAYQAARRGVAVYSLHTALDAAIGGTNDILADLLGIENRRPLVPSRRLRQCKIVVFVPSDDLSRVAEAAFAAGAGRSGNYFDCAFFCHGIGAFCGAEGTRPAVGQAGRHEVAEEMRLEMIAPRAKAAAVCSAIRNAHSYEQPAIDVYPLDDHPEGCGLGRIGTLPRAASVATLLARIKKATGRKHLLVARARGGSSPKGTQPVRTVACCAGSCGSLFRSALTAGAAFYLTGEMRHHDALAAAGAGMTVACLGHSHSERVVLNRVRDGLTQAAPKLGVIVSKRDKDPFEII